MDVIKRELKLLLNDNEQSPFEGWYRSLRSAETRARIRARLARVRLGNLGDHKILGGIGELRLDFGPGYRLYFALSGTTIVVLLAGGDKSTQEADILKARQFWEENKDAVERFQRDFRG